MLPNVPAMLEAHYGVAMAGAVLNSVNTRLDAAIIAFQFDHGEAKVLITDREFSKVVKDALALCKARPLIIDYDDPEFTGAGERLGNLDYEDFLREGDADFAWPCVDTCRNISRPSWADALICTPISAVSTKWSKRTATAEEPGLGSNLYPLRKIRLTS